MNADGSGMHQISFNTNHDFAPSVLANGQIVFSRWEVVNGTDQISLYRANPDGTGLQLYYGANSHATGANIAGTNNNVIQFLGARQRPDGTLLAIARPFLGTQLGGDILRHRCRAVRRDQSAELADRRAPAPGRRAPPRSASPPMRTCPPPAAASHSAVSAVRRDQPHAGELGALPGARSRRPRPPPSATPANTTRRQCDSSRRRSTRSGSTTSTPAR